MTIREVEELTGITRANVRFYEKEGLLFPKRNPINDYRDYSPKDVELLRRILFLRSLDVSVEGIRNILNGKADLRETVEKQREALRKHQEQTRERLAVCDRFLEEPELSFWSFPMEQNENSGERMPVSLRDTLSELWFFWDKLVVWGFLAFQIIYTIIVLPMLPEQIPITWSGSVVVEYGARWHFLVYLMLSVFFMFAARQILFAQLVGGLRCYIDELNAVLTLGGLGYGFSLQLYIVLYLQGLRMSPDTFQLCCAVFYLLIVGLIVLLYRRRKRVQ